MSDWVKNHAYTANYFKWQRTGSQNSARHIVPLVTELIHPKSVIEFGCGTGAWLHQFQKHGSTNILGLDGDYVLTSRVLQIPPAHFKSHDLNQPFTASQTYDLAISLEVAEHLKPASAATFIKSLTRASPVVLFSAAVPFQGGPNHLNEQWPDYWARLFRRHHFQVFDVFRPRIWHHPQIEWWYKQNLLLFINRHHLSHSPHLHQLSPASPTFLNLVHPQCFLESVAACPPEIFRKKRYSFT